MKLRAALISIATVGAMTAGIFARGGASPAPQRPAARQGGEKQDTALVFMKADESYTWKIDTGKVMCFVGNFAAHHKGAIITADSAVRYSDTYVECFGNVLINKNTTYIYGDRADYDSQYAEARVYSPLVKIVDGDAVLYTYNFTFDTDGNVGRFYGGGMVVNRENRLESRRGYYYADFREIICVEDVEIHSDTYEMRGDSVVYNIDTDHAWYFENSNIWNSDGDYLYADRGEYDKAEELYKVTSNGYILTEKQEVWSDTIDYYRGAGHAVLKRDIQIDDTEHRILAFGDYGEYWSEPGDAFLTRRPSVISYDTSQGDTLFMRSDSMYLNTVIFNPAAERRAAEAAAAAAAAADRQEDGDTGQTAAADTAAHAGRHGLHGGRGPAPDSLPVSGAAALARRHGADSPAVDSLGISADSIAADSAAADTVRLTREQQKALEREEAARLKAEKRAAAAAARKERLDRIAAVRLAKMQEQKVRDEAAAAARRERAAAKMRKRAERENARRARKGLPPLEIPAADSAAVDTLAADSSLPVRDSSAVDTLSAADSLSSGIAADTVDRDSMYRLVKGFRNVRIYRSDFQASCDSIVSVSSDSTVHMYINPVLWHGRNQVTSDVMDIFTSGGTVTRAEFVGRPIMASEIDTACYNQVTGKTMTALFRDGAIYRNDVNGNAQTIYYMQDGSDGEVTDMMYIESAGATFYIAEQTVDVITYRGDPVGVIYPMTPENMVPPTQIRRLPDFEWRGAGRPTREEVFDRTLRPSRRLEVGNIPRPEFPISRAIEEFKARLIERREWLDRVDVLSPEDEEFLRETLAAPYR